jgi:hypothetical protein
VVPHGSLPMLHFPVAAVVEAVVERHHLPAAARNPEAGILRQAAGPQHNHRC